MLPRPPSTTNTRIKMEVLKLNFVAWREEKFRPYRAPAAPARAAESTKAMSLYLVMLMPTLSAAMRLSRRAIMARPARLRTRFRTMMRVSITSTKPAVKVAMVLVAVAPWAPLMMAMPVSGSRCRSSMVMLPERLKAIWRPLASWPTSRQLTSSLMISPKASVTIAR